MLSYVYKIVCKEELGFGVWRVLGKFDRSDF